MICYYGCGNKAKYPPHKGTPHWCCESHWTRCPVNRKINSNSKKGKTPYNKGIKQSKNIKEKQSKTMKEKWLVDDIYRQKQSITRSKKEYKNHMKKIRIGKNNPMYGKHISQEHKILLRNNIESIKNKYPKFFKIEKLRMFNNNLQCKCKYCSVWFTPSRFQLYERIRQIENKDGNMKNYLYCCDEHKYLCSHSYRIDPKTLNTYKIYKRIVNIETDKSLKIYKIKNIELRGVDYHLDHRYSIKEGFKNCILPSIIGNINNLEIIISRDNIIKNSKCSISLEQLIGEYK